MIPSGLKMTVAAAPLVADQCAGAEGNALSLQLRFELLIEHDTSSSLTIPMGTTASPTEGIGTASADISGQTTETNGARSV